MLRCFSSPNPNPNSREDEETPTRSSSQPSPTVSLTNEYSLAVQTKSYNEIWFKIHNYNPEEEHHNTINHHQNQVSSSSTSTSSSSHHLVSQLLHPNRELVDQALHRVKPTSLTKLVSDYFDHSEKTSYLLCLLLRHRIGKARVIYNPLNELLQILPLDSLSQLQCDQVYDVFVEFSLFDNPFTIPVSENFQETRLCFVELKQQLDHRIKKTRKKNRFIRNSVLCLTTLVSNSLHVSLSSKLDKNKLQHIAQLDAAAKGAYVLNNDLDTIDRLVLRLHAVVESDKLLIRIGIERGRDKYSIQEVVKELRKNHVNFVNQLRDLEEHVCLCIAVVNRARSLLLQKIHLQEETM